jgi:hypothetical protein
MPGQEMMVNSEDYSSESDATNGYCIKVEVLKGGFKVSDPISLEQSGEYQNDDSELIPDIPSMLKNVLAVIQQNPIGTGEQEGFASVDQQPSEM